MVGARGLSHEASSQKSTVCLVVSEPHLKSLITFRGGSVSMCRHTAVRAVGLQLLCQKVG